jgi:hypothetical protein
VFNLKKYWQALREIEKTLPDYVWLYSQGGLVEVGAAVAARLLQAKSHRLATPEEIQQNREQQQELQKQQFQQRLRDQGIAVVTVEQPARKP